MAVKYQYETFHFLMYTFDVALAWQLIGDREPNTRMNGLTTNSGMLGFIQIDETKAMSDEVDLTVPLIAVRIKGTPTIIDGWHRIYKAHKTGIDSLPVHMLSERERDMILDDPTGKVVYRKTSHVRHSCGYDLKQIQNTLNENVWWVPWRIETKELPLDFDECPQCGRKIALQAIKPVRKARASKKPQGA